MLLFSCFANKLNIKAVTEHVICYKVTVMFHNLVSTAQTYHYHLQHSQSKGNFVPQGKTSILSSNSARRFSQSGAFKSEAMRAKRSSFRQPTSGGFGLVSTFHHHYNNYCFPFRCEQYVLRV